MVAGRRNDLHLQQSYFSHACFFPDKYLPLNSKRQGREQTAESRQRPLVYVSWAPRRPHLGEPIISVSKHAHANWTIVSYVSLQETTLYFLLHANGVGQSHPKSNPNRSIYIRIQSDGVRTGSDKICPNVFG